MRGFVYVAEATGLSECADRSECVVIFRFCGEEGVEDVLDISEDLAEKAIDSGTHTTR